MQTALAGFIKDTHAGREADAILRSCVHCGFCTATCPTYQLLGDELDGPRGRIYLIKQVLEGTPATATTQLHLDRCLTCRSCETTCPSGVRYGHLLDIGREIVDRQVPRSWVARAERFLLRAVLPYPRRFSPLLRMAQWIRPLFPTALKRALPVRQSAGSWPELEQARTMILLEGCVQSALAPRINAATARVLSRLGIRAVVAARAGCCGAVSHHTGAPEAGLEFARANIDAWWPHIEAGAQAIVMTASGCGSMVKEYGYLLRNDPVYADRAARVAALTRDLCEVLGNEDLSALPVEVSGRRVAFHAPCTLQHGQQIKGVVEQLLAKLGFVLTVVPDGHLCCGSAGTYSILQRDLSGKLKRNKLAALNSDQPDVVATANIGCLTHLQSGAETSVLHWVELLDADL
ncbi:MAG: glycolate oxidase subunit GlcF [Gammaproteobacteria bacterium]|nr:glycolate oxidase subunit GlcF [Gammaproteobacteria bacterium]